MSQYAKDWQKAYRQGRLEEINAYKLERGCMDCGYAVAAVALDFDHRPGEEKLANVANLVTASAERLYAEIAKCDVVCANCHRIRTEGRR